MENFEPSEAPDIVESPESTAPEASPDSGSSEAGSWPKDVQAEFTKKSQALADDRRSFEDNRQQWYAQQQLGIPLLPIILKRATVICKSL